MAVSYACSIIEYTDEYQIAEKGKHLFALKLQLIRMYLDPKPPLVHLRTLKHPILEEHRDINMLHKSLLPPLKSIVYYLISNQPIILTFALRKKRHGKTTANT